MVESQTLLEDPRRILGALCEAVGLNFDDAILGWPAGPKPEDGVWAPHWYSRAHQSTGWAPYKPKNVELLPDLEPVLEQAMPLYERLLPYQLS